MSDPSPGHDHDQEHGHSTAFYYRIYFILLGLLVVSVVGPMLGGLNVLLITAFGVALVKAVMVASYFMHLNVEKRFIWYLLIVAVIMLLVMFFGVAPDVMHRSGVNWKNLDTPVPTEAPAHH